MTDTTPPTVDEIKQALGYTARAISMEQVLVRLCDLLESGAYALVSREDREAAITAAVACGTNQMAAAFYTKRPASAELRATADLCDQTARTCLQLKDTP